MRKWFTSIEVKKITGIMLILCIAVMVQVISFWKFGVKLYDMSLNNSMDQVKELSVYVERNLRLELKRYIHTLRVIEAQLEDSGTIGVQEAIDTLSKASDVSQFKMLGVSDLDGKGVDAAGNQYDIFYDGIKEQIQNDEVYISNALNGNHETLIFIAVPLKINDEICGIVWGKYALANLLESMEFPDDGYKYFQIIDDNGRYLLSSNDKFALKSEHQSEDKTIWDEMERYQYANGMSVQKIHEMVQRQERGSYYFEYDGEGRYVDFRPLKINNWYLFSVQVADELHTYVRHAQQNSIHLFIILIIGLLAVFGAIYNLFYTMYKRIAKQNREIEAVNGTLQATLRQTKNLPFTIDYKLRQIVLYGYPVAEENRCRSFDEVRPKNVLNRGLLAPECVETYEKLYQMLIVRKEKCDPTIIHAQIGENRKWLRVSIISDFAENNDQMIGVLEDYGEQMEKDLRIESDKRNIRTIEKKSQIDFLTNLYNRKAFLDKMKPALEEHDQKQQMCALIILDLDHFKEVNDSMGHGMGDTVLQKTATILSGFFRTEDFVGRLGGDEFVIFVKNITNVVSFENRLKELNQMLCQTYQKNDRSVQVSASIGVALTDGNQTSFEEMYEKADEALYQVKRAMRNGYQIYSQDKP